MKDIHMTRPRFRQSYAKILLEACPALLKRELDGKRKLQSKAIDAGSLVDYLVFGQSDRYEVVEAVYASGDREGQQAEDWTCKAAKVAAKDARARDLLPVLPCELEAVAPTAEAIRRRIIDLANERGDSPEIIFQPRVEWISGLGVECEGTPDVLVVYPERGHVSHCISIDVKHTAAMQQDKFNRQVRSMGWDVQGWAYGEAAISFAGNELGRRIPIHLEHWIISTLSLEQGLPPCARKLSGAYMEVGKRLWERTQREWLNLLASNHWPGYPELDAEPPLYVTRSVLEAYDPEAFPEEEP